MSGVEGTSTSARCSYSHRLPPSSTTWYAPSIRASLFYIVPLFRCLALSHTLSHTLSQSINQSISCSCSCSFLFLSFYLFPPHRPFASLSASTRFSLSLRLTHCPTLLVARRSLPVPALPISVFTQMATTGFPVAVARPPEGCTVVIETQTPVSGTITVEVDSSAPSKNFV